MKKAYTITPDRYTENNGIIRDVEYNYGHQESEETYMGFKFKTVVDIEDVPKYKRKRYERAVRENAEVVKPSLNNSIFFYNEDNYNLWLNRDTDEPITARELYNIVRAIETAIR